MKRIKLKVMNYYTLFPIVFLGGNEIVDTTLYCLFSCL